jgi:hypothetical protein
MYVYICAEENNFLNCCSIIYFVSGDRVLGRIFWLKRDEVTGEWRKLHNEELSDLYCSPNIV